MDQSSRAFNIVTKNAGAKNRERAHSVMSAKPASKGHARQKALSDPPDGAICRCRASTRRIEFGASKTECQCTGQFVRGFSMWSNSRLGHNDGRIEMARQRTSQKTSVF